MTDGLFDLGPLFDGVSGIVAEFGGYLAVILGVYLGLFVVGLVIEAMRSSKSSSE